MTTATVTGSHDLATTVWNISDIIEQQARAHPAAPAVILSNYVISYRELMAGVLSIARKLLDQDVHPGQLLGVSMRQTPGHLMTLLAIARIGAVSVPVHTALSQEHRYLAARHFAVSAIVSGRSDQHLQGIPFIMLGDINLTGPQAVAPSALTGPDDPCWIAVSSENSGTLKGVLCTHGSMHQQMHQGSFTCTPQSRLLTMDLNFPLGFINTLRVLAAGGAVVLTPDFSAAELVHLVRSHGVTHWPLSAAMAAEIAPLLVEDDWHFPSLACLLIVGGTPDQRLLDILWTRFSPHVFVVYGTTETGPVTAATPAMLSHVPHGADSPA